MTSPFTGPQLQNVHHQRADMTGTHFDGVNLADAKFFAVMTNATFTSANLSNLKIAGVTLENTKISDANLTGMKINGILVTDLLAAYEKP